MPLCPSQRAPMVEKLTMYPREPGHRSLTSGQEEAGRMRIGRASQVAEEQSYGDSRNAVAERFEAARATQAGTL